MLDIYLLTLALSIGIGAATTVVLLAVSRTERFIGLFNVRGPLERPRWGGVVFVVTFAVTPFIAAAVSDHASEFFTPHRGSFLGFVAAVSLVFLVGFLDDVKLTSPGLRTLVVAVSATAVYAAGYRIDDVGLPWGMEIQLGFFGFFVTVAWIWLITNAMNLIDGRDGVALGVAIFAALTLATVAASSSHPTVAILLIALVGGGLGFLPFNLPPASSYVGDSGAYVLGFILGTLSIRAATGPTDHVFIAVPIIALGYPILDIGVAFGRRLLQHKHPMIGDGDHIHSRIEAAGAGPRGLLLITYTLAVLFCVGAILMHEVSSTWVEAGVLVALLTTVAALLLKLGYVLTIWNSNTVVWLRQRLFAPDETTARQ